MTRKNHPRFKLCIGQVLWVAVVLSPIRKTTLQPAFENRETTKPAPPKPDL
jgi:hypothetical protein